MCSHIHRFGISYNRTVMEVNTIQYFILNVPYAVTWIKLNLQNETYRLQCQAEMVYSQ